MTPGRRQGIVTSECNGSGTESHSTREASTLESLSALLAYIIGIKIPNDNSEQNSAMQSIRNEQHVKNFFSVPWRLRIAKA